MPACFISRKTGTISYLKDISTGHQGRKGKTQCRTLRKDGSSFWGSMLITASHDVNGRYRLYEANKRTSK